MPKKDEKGRVYQNVFLTKKADSTFANGFVNVQGKNYMLGLNLDVKDGRNNTQGVWLRVTRLPDDSGGM